jgi:FeS assembly protein IscX
MVMQLDEFKEGDSKCGERVLEAIQMNWIEEVE